ncbi:MAG: peptidoglycan DD-metalloendopeptidase family protein [Spirochaetes bacterium]|nr:peptidoglycan DD-metalloendopeptidase family protein [Spirochaetota bacterium]
MHKNIYKTFKFRNITLSKIDNEFLLVINKKDRVELKRFKFGKSKSGIKPSNYFNQVVDSDRPVLRRAKLRTQKPLFKNIKSMLSVIKFNFKFAMISIFCVIAVSGGFAVKRYVSGHSLNPELSAEGGFESAVLEDDGNSENIENTDKADVVDDDEKLKNQILLSDNTNYSEEEKVAPLQVSIYKVQAGDTLSEIAKKNGVSMDTIIGSSGLNSYDLIRQGQVLRIPNRDGILHTMKKDQRLIDISEKYKIPIEKIIAQNNLSNPDFISQGTDVFIPDAKPQNIVPGFLWPVPVYRVTSAFGWRYHPVYHQKRYHTGIDIAAKYQWVKSTRYGKVTYAGWMGGYGNVVIIAHPGGWKSLYGHLSRIIVKQGQYVKQGQLIAKSGNTGVSTGPHLHFEIILNGKHVNPRKYAK